MCTRLVRYILPNVHLLNAVLGFLDQCDSGL